MKILAFNDIHGSKRAISHLVATAKKENVDLLVCAGDISIFEDNLYRIISSFKSVGKPLIIIPGNHEGEDYLREICKKHKFCIYLHKNHYNFGDFMFFGYGGGGFSSRYKDLEVLTKKIKVYKMDKKIIFVTHAPVFGTKTDYLDYSGHVGSKSAREFVLEIKPIVVICGHLHENEGVIDHIGKTLIINPGRMGKILEI